MESAVAQFAEFFLFTLQDVKHVLYIALGLTILRFIVDFTLFKVSVYVCVVFCTCACVCACVCTY